MARRRKAAQAADDLELGDKAPVYDDRGNVRPRGTPGACRMTRAERVRIAEALAKGEAPPALPRRPEVPLPKAKAGDGDAEASS